MVELYAVKKATSEGISSYKQEKDRLIKQYNTKPSFQEYVIIPRNNFVEIAQNSQENERYLHDVLNVSWFSDYEEAKPMESHPEDFIKFN